MKLVACPDCHAQYDITDRAPGSAFECHCGTTLEATAPVGVDAPVQRCSACGAVAHEHAEFCAYCGQGIVRVDHAGGLICPECMARNDDGSRFCLACGVAFAPTRVKSEVSELDCPCCEIGMIVREVGGLLVHECAKCHGLWAPSNVFDALVQRATTLARERIANGEGNAPRHDGGNPFEGLDPFRAQIEYRRCPDCGDHMARRNYRKRSGVVIDQCRQHGTWLDAHELERIAGFVLSGRADEAARIEAERRVAAERRAKRDASREPRMLSVESESDSLFGRRRDRGVAETIFDLLTSVLD